MKFLRQIVGENYASDGASRAVPLPLMATGYAVYVHSLVSANPRALVTTRTPELKPHAIDYGLSLNLLFEEIELKRSLREVVASSMLSLGVMKVGVAESPSLERAATQPFAERVDIDDWVQDMNARSWNEIGFCGNRYRVHLDDLRASEFSDQTVIDNLTKEGPYDWVSESGGKTFPSSISAGDSSEDPYYDMVEVYDIWLPREKLFLTVPRKFPDKVIRTMEWEGPSHGPYHRLGFLWPDGNNLPLPPAAMWLDLHILANELFRKTSAQARRQKSNLIVNNPSDAERARKSMDGDIMPMSPGTDAREVSWGGADQKTLSVTALCKDMFSYFAGNIDVIGGLAPGSRTFSQDKLMAESADVRMRDMQQSVLDLTRNVMRDIAFYRWKEPIRTDVLTKRIDGIDFDFVSKFGPSDRAGMFFDYQFEVAPYSMTYKTPEQRLSTLMQIVQQVILPGAPMLAQSRQMFDFGEFVRTIADLSDIAELKELIKGDPNAGGLRMSQDRRQDDPSILTSGSPPTKRTYERISRSGPPIGGDQSMSNAVSAMSGTDGANNESGS